MDEMKFTVAVPVDDYARLVENETKLEVLTDVLLETAQLSFNRKALRFDDDTICTLLKTMTGYRYEVRLKDLQREREDTLCAAEPDSTTIKV